MVPTVGGVTWASVNGDPDREADPVAVARPARTPQTQDSGSRRRRRLTLTGPPPASRSRPPSHQHPAPASRQKLIGP